MVSCIRSPKRPSQSSHPDRNFAIDGPTLLRLAPLRPGCVDSTTVQLKLRWVGGRCGWCALPCAHVSAPRGAAFSGDVSAVRTGRRHALHGGHEARRGQGLTALPGMPPRMADRNADESGDGSSIDHDRLIGTDVSGGLSLPSVGREDVDAQSGLRALLPSLLQSCCQDFRARNSRLLPRLTRERPTLTNAFGVVVRGARQGAVDGV